jgi:hypothetical protein
MIISKPTHICTVCGTPEPKEQTAFPSFGSVPDRFNDLKDHLQNFYTIQKEYKRVLQSNLDLLESFPHSKENKIKCDEQRKNVLEKVKAIENYLMDMVIKMYIDTK